MERRGELPKGTAKRWADETKSIKSLPEKKMKKEAMFFGEREEVEGGNFMKLANELKPPKKTAPALPLKQPKPEPLPLSPPSGEMPVKPKKPEVSLGTGCKIAMPFGTGIGIAGSPQFGGSGTASSQIAANVTNASSAPSMGTGGKAKKGTEKKAEDLGDELAETGKEVVRGTARTGHAGLKAIREAPDWAKAGLLGIPAYMLYRKGKKAVSSIGRRAAPKAGGAISTALRKLLTRGR